MSWLVCEPKTKWKEDRTKEAIQAEVVAFLQHLSKSRHCAKCLQQEALQLKDDARNHGNIDIILILEKPSFLWGVDWDKNTIRSHSA